ncbi:TadE family type IV pilus minor pilin [Streptomyces macrolidinus]|uniref:TadE family type IV pilus minor pilin n=1 Tax=Streptomyces macrolidinus TaxID=2952607 RepID=UPI0027E2851F|nr:TadE family type IV pilus minor pilin [Streptomyces macrolidinus]
MTAEAAVVLPVLVFVLGVFVWALLAVSAQIQCVDAARAGARAAARQESPGVVEDTAARAAPKGAKVTTSRQGDLVHVTVLARTPGPAALPLEVRQEAVASAEDAVGVGQ